MTHRIYATGFIDIGPAVSESQGFENVDTTQTDGRTDGRTDGHLTNSTSHRER